MLNGLILLQYSFLNGYLLHRSFLRGLKSDGFETVLISLLLSICTNSLILYILVRLFEMPITKISVSIMSLVLSVSILGISKIIRT